MRSSHTSGDAEFLPGPGLERSTDVPCRAGARAPKRRTSQKPIQLAKDCLLPPPVTDQPHNTETMPYRTDKKVLVCIIRTKCYVVVLVGQRVPDHFEMNLFFFFEWNRDAARHDPVGVCVVCVCVVSRTSNLKGTCLPLGRRAHEIEPGWLCRANRVQRTIPVPPPIHPNLYIHFCF